jgi:glycogen operon protein
VHDGFTLTDLVSYSRKHNNENGENNHDGSDHNVSTNCGVEGPTDDPESLTLRNRLRASMLACLLLAQGVPLVLAGDEVGNSQKGNNNPYCQDNPIGWVDWSGLDREDADLTALIQRCTELRRRFPQLRQSKWVDGRRADGSYGVLWLTPAGTEMTHEDWIAPELCFLSYVLAPEGGGQPLYVVLNAGPEGISLTLPQVKWRSWRLLLNTAGSLREGAEVQAGAQAQVSARSVLAFAGVA